MNVAVAGVRAAVQVRQQPQAEFHHMCVQWSWEKQKMATGSLMPCLQQKKEAESQRKEVSGG